MKAFNPDKELNKIQRGNKNKIIFTILFCIILVTIGYSFALYQVRYSKRIIYTKVAPFSNYDIDLAVFVDGKKQDTFPTKESKYTYSFMECDNNTKDYTYGSWDDANWALDIKTKGPNKCNIYFSSEENVKIFNLTRTVEQYTIPKAGTYLLEVWGAQGGGGGGYGGHSYGQIKLNQNDVLYVVVGSTGSNASGQPGGAGGYNGGGAGGYGLNWTGGPGGGGATHIATKTGLLSELSTSQDSVLIVAGGGGGNGVDHATIYATGGGLEGGNAPSDTAKGGTQTTGYAFGVGAGAPGYCVAGQSGGKGGSGGGWYGGYAAPCDFSGGVGAGGSGYLNNSKLISGTARTENGIKEGDGMARIVFLK